MSETLLTIRIPNGPTALPAARKWLDEHGISDSALVGIESRDSAERHTQQSKGSPLAVLRELHRPFGIYGDCGHDHDNADGVLVHEIDEIGLTCAHEYDICRHCCAGDGEGQTEACITYHDHGPGKPICKTAEILARETEQALQPTPIPMWLKCPYCFATHIDRDEWASRPHKTHLCEACGQEWRPAEVYTVGIEPWDKALNP